MSSGEVRLRYSGFILFLSRLFSVGTGLAFSLMVTRSISAEEFGVYGNLGDILAYFTLAASIVPFWATRFVARKHLGSSITGLTANLLISLPSALIYLVSLPVLLSAFQIGEGYLIIYAILAFQILEVYMHSAFEATLQAKRPQAVGFGFLIFELSKVVLGFVLIMQLRLGLFGAVVSVISAYVFQLLFYLKLILPEFNEKIRWTYVKEWIKASPFNLYSIAGRQLVALYFILLFVYGGKLARAYYGSALVIASSIGHSSLLAYALYPRLLSKDQPEDIYTSLKMVLMFAIPMATGAIVLSDSYLVILDPVYRVAKLVLVVLSLDIFYVSLSSIFETVVTGTEKLDVEAKISYKNIIRSKLFVMLSLPYIQAAVIVPLVYFVLSFTVKDPVEAAAYVALIVLVTDTALTAIKYRIAKKRLNFDMPWKHIGKYLTASAFMALTLYLLPTPTRLLTTVAATALGVCIYFLVLSAVDSESRDIAKAAMRELLRMLGISSG